MSDRLELDYDLAEADHLSAVRKHCVRSSLRVGLVCIGGLAVVLAIIHPSDLSNITINGIGGGAIALLLIIPLYATFFLPLQVRRTLREQKSATERRHLAADDDGFSIEQPSGVFRSLWADILMWDETKLVIALYINRIMMIPLPKGALGSEGADYIRERLRASGLTTPGKRRPS